MSAEPSFLVSDGGGNSVESPLLPSSGGGGAGGKVEPGRGISPRGAELFGSLLLPGAGPLRFSHVIFAHNLPSVFARHIFTHGGGTAQPDRTGRLWVQRVRFANTLERVR